ncbi:DUF882 domain-containing protein [Plastoroseomonas arctica]|uniref:Murein endopeptidase K n=1 Tax=Plastoroseomonas arctica TaxID=1509237 RepID=A0AAF1K298_9PROT|nr:DUF882 domain-containing protein [Plastoroseomonas arctica]MBR0655059.1 DUF882 domain-containing protein [Plastoroseomonas arctica]
MRFIEACPCCADAQTDTAPALPRRAWLRGAAGLLTLSAAACAPDASTSPGPTTTSAGADSYRRGRDPGPASLASGPPRSLRVRRGATGDSFSGVYWQNGRYDREAMAKLNAVFRDPGRDEATPMDPRLFDILARLHGVIGSQEPYELLSGYRTPETNAAGAARSRRVSRVSLHMSGMAADVRLADRPPLALARLAAELQTGGIGLYSSGFVHVDCGPARRW